MASQQTRMLTDMQIVAMWLIGSQKGKNSVKTWTRESSRSILSDNLDALCVSPKDFNEAE